MRWNEAENAVIARGFGVFEWGISREARSDYLIDEIEKTVLFGRFSCFWRAALLRV